MKAKCYVGILELGISILGPSVLGICVLGIMLLNPTDVRAHLVQGRTSDPLTLALHADKIFQSRVSFASIMNHVSSAPILREEFPVHVVRPQASPCAPPSSTPGPSSCPAPVAPSPSRWSLSLSLLRIAPSVLVP